MDRPRWAEAVEQYEVAVAVGMRKRSCTAPDVVSSDEARSRPSHRIAEYLHVTPPYHSKGLPRKTAVEIDPIRKCSARFGATSERAVEYTLLANRFSL